MLVVISDLHFSEEASNQIWGSGIHDTLVFHRNLPVRAYRMLISRLAADAVRSRSRRMHFVLAGDIFDLHRSGLWFWENPTGARPYVSSANVESDLEAMILRILAGIAEEKHVREVLPVLQLLASGRYLDDDDVERPFPIPVELHYIPGNHDRLANATPTIRRAVRGYLGLPDSDAPFSHVLDFPEEQAMVRHGHEYDYSNFAVDYSDVEEIPFTLPDSHYDTAPFGDFATVDGASRFPFMFRQFHNDDIILGDPTLRRLYLRLLEFDDLRPLSAVFNYFLYADGADISVETAWSAIEPILIAWLNDISDDLFLHRWLDIYDKKGSLDVIDAVQAVLALKPWRWTNSIPLGLAESIAQRAISGTRDEGGARLYAARESTVRNGCHRYLIAGHTHHPGVDLIAHDGGGERYYINTGTWRNRIPSTPDFKQFGRLKALTYVIAYGPEEDRGGLAADEVKVASVDFWSGVTQRWEQLDNRVQPANLPV